MGTGTQPRDPRPQDRRSSRRVLLSLLFTAANGRVLKLPRAPAQQENPVKRRQSPQPLGKTVGHEAQGGDTGFCLLQFLGHRMLSPAFTRKSMSGACWNALSRPPYLGPHLYIYYGARRGGQEALPRKMRIDAGGQERAHC